MCVYLFFIMQCLWYCSRGGQWKGGERHLKSVTLDRNARPLRAGSAPLRCSYFIFNTLGGSNSGWGEWAPCALLAPAAALPHRDLDLSASHGIIIALQITDFILKTSTKKRVILQDCFSVVGKFTVTFETHSGPVFSLGFPVSFDIRCRLWEQFVSGFVLITL